MAAKIKPQLKSRALLYVSLCRGNHVAAALYDWVRTFSEIVEPLKYKEPFYTIMESKYEDEVADEYIQCNSGPFREYFGYQVDSDGGLVVTIESLRDVVVPQLLPPAEVSDQALWEALAFLAREHLIFWPDRPDDDEPKSPYLPMTLELLGQHDSILAELYYGHPVSEEKPLYDTRRERRVVREQRSRAARIGQAASLTFEEWVETLVYFRGRCAFFAEHPYEVLEHFVPVTSGGGTTIFNCIPACKWCNAIKADRLPADLRETRLGEALPRVQEYLDRQREQWIQKYS